MTANDDLAVRKAHLIAQCDLDRMRLAHALLVTRRSLNPFAGGRVTRSLAARALGLALPLFQGARRYGIVRFVAFGVAIFRAVRGFLRR